MEPFLLTRIALALFVAYDAHKRNMALYYVALLAMFTFILPIVVAPGYFLFRNRVQVIAGSEPRSRSSRFKNQSILCPKCGTDNPGNVSECTQCHNKLRLN